VQEEEEEESVMEHVSGCEWLEGGREEKEKLGVLAKIGWWRVL